MDLDTGTYPIKRSNSVTGRSPRVKYVERICYGLSEASAAIGISEAFLHHEANAGRLKTFRLGKRILIRVEDLKEYLAENAKCGPAH